MGILQYSPVIIKISYVFCNNNESRRQEGAPHAKSGPSLHCSLHRLRSTYYTICMYIYKRPTPFTGQKVANNIVAFAFWVNIYSPFAIDTVRPNDESLKTASSAALYLSHLPSHPFHCPLVLCMFRGYGIFTPQQHLLLQNT